MRLILIISLIIGVAVFLGTFWVGISSSGLSIPMALMTGVVTGVAVAISILILPFCVFTLVKRDQARWRRLYTNRQEFLKSRVPVFDAEYLTHFAAEDSGLALNIRESLAGYFKVPSDRIHPQDDLQDDLWYDRFLPMIASLVTRQGLSQLDVKMTSTRVVKLNEPGAKTINDLVQHVRRTAQMLQET